MKALLEKQPGASGVLFELPHVIAEAKGKLYEWALHARKRVRIQGKYSGGAETFLRVQRWEGGK